MTFATKENAAEAFRMAEHALESDLGEDGGVIRIAEEDLEFIRSEERRVGKECRL